MRTPPRSSLRSNHVSWVARLRNELSPQLKNLTRTLDEVARGLTLSKYPQAGWPHSIRSSACARTCRESGKPIALTVFRLITSSTLVGNWTGNSLILAPRKMRSM